MAVISSNTKHARSISLPSKSHPLTQRVEEHLCRLGASSEATTSISSSTIAQNLNGLCDLYDCVDDLLHLPLVQQAMAHEQQEPWVEEVMDGSLKLLDVCGNARDLLSQMKENVQVLQSVFRRRSSEVNIVNEAAHSYISSKKKSNKGIRKCLQELKKMESKSSIVLLDKDPEVVAIVRMLREVEANTVSMFESLLVFTSGSASSRASSWSLLSKLTQSKRIGCEGAESEVATVDVAMNALVYILQKSGKKMEAIEVQNAQSRLESLELSINSLESQLEGVFRRLIKARVSLLNFLNH